MNIAGAPGQRNRGSAWRHFDPTMAIAQWLVESLLETKLAHLEVQRTLLVAHRNPDGVKIENFGHDRLLSFELRPARYRLSPFTQTE